MKNKLIWIILAVILLGGIGYYKYLYPNSQADLQANLVHEIAMPVDHYLESSDADCGIWYQREEGGKIVSGRSNDSVKSCFAEAFKTCKSKKIVFINDQTQTDQKKIVYSFIKTIRGNDQNECIIQNFFEEQSTQETLVDMPLTFVNTCTVLSDTGYDSCEPLFIKQDRKNRESDAIYKDETK